MVKKFIQFGSLREDALNINNYTIKLVLTGDSGVGKSTLMNAYLGKEFSMESNTTIGVDFGHKIMTIKEHQIKIYIWDTAGQEAFRTLTKVFYRNIAGAIIVFDVSKQDTFNNLDKWIKDLKSQTNTRNIIIVGCKTDLNDQRKVSYDTALAYATLHGYLYEEVSSLKDNNVDTPFIKLGTIIHNQLLDNTSLMVESNGIFKSHDEDIISEKHKKKSINCCRIL